MSAVETVATTDQRQSYAAMHRPRFEFCIERVRALLAPGSAILDLGCHFLDQAVLFRELGYHVSGVDAAPFSRHPDMQARARAYGIPLSTALDLSTGAFAEEFEDSSFDGLLLTEVIEHLAFNPLPMWKTVFRLLKPGALIVLTTPNAMRLEQRVIELIRNLSGRGMGEPVSGIFATVTYGHHWKEYSMRELRRYFEILGVPEEAVSMETYHYRQSDPAATLGQRVRNGLRAIGNRLPSLREEIFLVARLPDPKPNIPEHPRYF